MNQIVHPCAHMRGKRISLLLLLRILQNIVAEKHCNAVKENDAVPLPRLAQSLGRLIGRLVGRPVGGAAGAMETHALLHLVIIDLRRCDIGNGRAMLLRGVCRIMLRKRGFARARSARDEDYLSHVRHASTNEAAAAGQPAKCR